MQDEITTNLSYGIFFSNIYHSLELIQCQFDFILCSIYMQPIMSNFTIYFMKDDSKVATVVNCGLNLHVISKWVLQEVEGP